MDRRGTPGEDVGARVGRVAAEVDGDVDFEFAHEPGDLQGTEALNVVELVESLEHAGTDAALVVLSGDPLSIYTQVLETWVEGTKVFDRSDPKDRLVATGGFGAGDPRRARLCCFEFWGGDE